MQRLSIGSLIVFILLLRTAHASPLSERLGFAPSDRVVILHMDDLGTGPGSLAAARAAIDFGLTQTGSLIMPAPAAADAGRVLGPSADLGIHLTLNGGGVWPSVTPADLIPSLTEAGGLLQRSLPFLAIFTKTADVEREMESQIQAGLRVAALTHLDTHMGTVFLRPAWFRAYLRLAREYKLVPMIPRRTGSWPVLGKLVRPLISKIEKTGYLALDDFYLLSLTDQNYDERKARYLKILRNLKPGVTEIVLHPSNPEAGIETARYLDAQILRDPEFKRALEVANIKTIGFREIQARYPWSSLTN